MIIRGKGILLAAGVLGSIFAGAMPALAQHGGGGGGHGGGGGGHAAGVHGGGAAHFSGGGHYAGGGRAYGGGAAYHGGAAFHGGFQGRAGYGYPGHFAYGRGYSTGAYLRGGYWNGGFWPRAYYGLGFSWFLPILPLAYSTYWWGGVPYYYANDVYYTYDPNYQGYIATDPKIEGQKKGFLKRKKEKQFTSCRNASSSPRDRGSSTKGRPPWVHRHRRRHLRHTCGRRYAQQPRQ